MNIHQQGFMVLAKRLFINTLIFLVLGLNFSFSYAQTCGSGSNLIANRWTMVALPCLPTTATVQGVFGDDLSPANYDLRWVVYERDESTDSYVKLTLASALSQGNSYWILSLDAASYDVDGTATPLNTVNANCPSADGCFETMLTPPDSAANKRQNMVGHPFPFDIDWAAVVVEVDGTAYTPSAADAAGFVSKTINKYNGNGYDPFDDVTPAMEGVLTAFDGIWVEALGGSSGKSAKLLIPGGNQPPVAVDDAVSTDEDTVLNGDVTAANPTDPDSDLESPLPAAPITEVNGNAANINTQINLGSGALLTLNGDGTFSYDPNGLFEALKASPDLPNEDTDTFDYTLEDDMGLTDTATVTVTITGVNDAPIANDDAFMTAQTTAITMADVMADNGSGPDQDPETDTTSVTLVNGNPFVSGVAFALPSGAMLSMQTNGIFSYDPTTLTTPPPGGGNVMDSFSYQLCDPAPACSNATVTVTVTSTVAFPVAQDISGTVLEDSAMNSVAISVTGGAATVSSVTQPTNGSSNFSGTNVLYTPDLNFCNDPPGTTTDDFTYTITPGGSTANVNITVTCVNDKPTAVAPGPFAVTGNIKINGTGLLASVTDPDGAGNPPGPFTVGGTVPTGSANGGSVSINTGTGTFTYDPAPGFEGADSFNYQVCDNGTPAPGICSDAVTVNLTVGDMIWFIDNSQGVNGNGRLSSPFNSVANFNSGAADEAGDIIFLYRQSATNYTGPLTLLNDQTLIGQGATASIVAITGITLAPLSDPLPTTGGTRPVIAHSTNNLTLAQNNTVRGLDLSNTGGTALTGNNFGNLNLAKVSVNNTSGIAINLNNGNPTASFTSVSASGAANGIVLNSTTGSFTVAGDGSTATQGGNGSGGTIQNTSGSGLLLTNANSVLLNNMSISNTGLHGVQATSITNFDLAGVTISGSGNALNEHGIFITNLIGTGGTSSNFNNLVVNNSDGDTAILILQTAASSGELLIDGPSQITNALEGGFEARTQNAGAQLDIIIGNTSAAGVGETVVIENTNIGAAFFAENGVLNATVRNSQIRNGAGLGTISRPGSGVNGVMFLGISGQSTGSAADITLNVNGNDIDHESAGAGGTGRSGIALGGAGNVNGTISNNTVDSNDEFTDAFFTNFTGVGTTSANQITISGNTFNLTGSGGNDTIAGIEINASDSSGGLSTTITNNNITYAGDNGFSGGIILVAGDTGGGDNNTLCVDISSNHVSNLNSGSFAHYGFVHFSSATLNIAGIGPGVVSDAQVDTHIITNDNPAATTAAADVNANVGTINGVASCP